jgi:anaerobic selenocysteine-containing dehydrogenase
MFIFGANPAVTDGDTHAVRKALSELEFLVVADLFMTATARFADIILPAASFLESDLYSNKEKIIDPPGEAWPDHKIFIELGKKMGFEGEFQTDFSAPVRHKSNIQYRKYLKHGFPTSSGKVELYSRLLEDLGYSALPDFIEPCESISNPDSAGAFPLVLTTGAKLSMYTHSQFRNIPRLRKLQPNNYFMVNRNTAEKFGIEDGAKVIVESPTGCLSGVVKTTPDLLENVVQVYHGFENMNANLLTSSKFFDPATGSPGLKSSVCKITLEG